MPGYGWKPSLPDQRDLRHNFLGAPVADQVDLRDSGKLPPIWDQGQLGSCVSHGVAGAYCYDAGEGATFDPSRLFLYYNGRVIEGTVDEDSGLTCADGIKALAKYGLAPASDWPYDINQFTEQPPKQAYDDGILREATKYARVDQTAQAMQACLTAGTPIVVGFTVYESFESDAVARTGDVPMPGKREQVLGGHCVLVVGYIVREGQPVWICRNSWGDGWGDHGYFYMPQKYLLSASLSDDFWTVQAVSSPDPTPVPPQPTPPAPPEPTPTPQPTPPAPATGALAFLDAMYGAAKAFFATGG